ncbi:MAG: hypothetical protein ACTSU5_09165 [Promethearchaeota archaeon]
MKTKSYLKKPRKPGYRGAALLGLAVTFGVLLAVLPSTWLNDPVTIAEVGGDAPAAPLPRVSGLYSFFDKFGTSGTGDGQLSSPFGVAINSTGHVYVTNPGSDQVQVFNASGEFVTRWGSTGSGDGQFTDPYGIATNSTGHVYVVDSGNDRIQVFDQLGNYLFEWGSSGTGDGQFLLPYGIAVNASGYLYVTEYNNDRVSVFNHTGEFLYKWGSSGSGDGQFNHPGQIAVNSSGHVYVTDRFNDRVQVFNQTGGFVYSWGVNGGGNGQFFRPNGIALNGSGFVYVADTLNHRVQVFNQSGEFVASWGSSGSADGQFASPDGIAVNGSSPGYVYVADTLNNRIQVFGNTPPNASGVTLSPDPPANGTAITLTYTYSDANGDPEGAPRVRWYNNSVHVAAYDNLTTLPASATKPGEKWNASVQAFDGIHYGPVNWSNTVEINTPPTASAVQIVPDPANSSVAINVSYTYGDANGDTEGTPRIRWYRDNVSQPLYNDLKTIPSVVTHKGEVWNASLEVFDGKDYGTLVWTQSVNISNSHPEASNVQLSPDPPGNDSAITLTYSYADNDSDAEQAPRVRWYNNSVHVAAYDNLTTLPASATKPGETWNATVEPYDGTDYGPAVWSQTVTVNHPPTASSVQLVPDPANSSVTLNVTYTYGDSDSNPEGAPRIRWYRDGVHQSAYDDLKVLPASATTRGDDWNATIEVFDGIEYGELVWTQTVTITNSLPEASNVQIVPIPPKTLDDLQLSYTYSDNDGDASGSPRVRWYRNGAHVATYDDQLTVPSSATTLGENWNATVEPFDGYAYGPLVWTQTVTIGNILPVASDLSITPYPAYTTDALVLNYTYSDAEGDPEGLSRIQWYRNGVHEAAYDGLLVVPATVTVAHEQWRASVEPFDGYNYGSTYWSPAVIIKENAAPAITHPADLSYEENSTGNAIEWTVYDDTARGQSYVVLRNGTSYVETSNWTAGVPVSVPVDGLSPGTWNFTILVSDGLGGQVSDTVIVIVTALPTASGGDVPGIPPVPLLGFLGITLLGLAASTKKSKN